MRDARGDHERDQAGIKRLSAAHLVVGAQVQPYSRGVRMVGHHRESRGRAIEHGASSSRLHSKPIRSKRPCRHRPELNQILQAYTQLEVLLEQSV